MKEMLERVFKQGKTENNWDSFCSWGGLSVSSAKAAVFQYMVYSICDALEVSFEL